MRGCGVLCLRYTAAAMTIGPDVSSLSSQAQKPPGRTPLQTYPSSCIHASLQSVVPPRVIPPPPAPMRGSFIDRKPLWASFNENHAVKSFRGRIAATADISLRPPQFPPIGGAKCGGNESAENFGERLEEMSVRWAAKFYGNVTFGPRNYPYPSSRWLARRFKMKKHKIIKRFRFRRYKLAAVANLPFAKMIRVGLLPDLKSSKTKKGDSVEADLSGRLVSAVRGAGGKQKGHRGRPKSKYQV